MELCDDVLKESWSGLSMRQPINRGGFSAPAETADSLRYKGSFSVDPGNGTDKSMASGQNPGVGEQEEGEVIDKEAVFFYIDEELKNLDIDNNLDRSAILALSNLKKMITRA